MIQPEEDKNKIKFCFAKRIILDELKITTFTPIKLISGDSADLRGHSHWSKYRLRNCVHVFIEMRFTQHPPQMLQYFTQTHSHLSGTVLLYTLSPLTLNSSESPETLTRRI